MANIREEAIRYIVDGKATDEELKSFINGSVTLTKEQKVAIYNSMRLRESMELIAKIKNGDEYDQVMEEIENIRNSYFSRVKTMEKARAKKKK